MRLIYAIAVLLVAATPALAQPRYAVRVFDIDIEHCPNCGGELKIIAAIEDPAVIVRILGRLTAEQAG